MGICRSAFGNFVRLLHERYGLRFLLLGGDSKPLPSRLIPYPGHDEDGTYREPYASDAYFGCLDGDWNRDGDDFFGELEPGDHDAPDTVAEVHVGRVPVETTHEVEVFVKKLLLYERPAHHDYQDRVAYVGARANRSHDPHGHYRSIHGRYFAKWSFSPRFHTVAHEKARAADVWKTLSDGVGVVCHDGHALPGYLQLPVGRLDVASVTNVRNAERPFVLFSNGCYAGRFTDEGVAEELLFSGAGGAAAFMGSTSVTAAFVSERHESDLWNALLGDEADPRLGEALSRVRGLMRGGTGSAPLEVVSARLALTLLGDPATPLWRGRPGRTAAAVRALPSGRLRVTVATRGAGALRVACHQAGRWGASREAVPFPAGVDSVVVPAVIGNGAPLRVTVLGAEIAPTVAEVPDPVPVHVTGVHRGADDALLVSLRGAPDLRLPLPEDLGPGTCVTRQRIDGFPLRLVLPILDGADVGYLKDDVEVRFPGFARMGADRERERVSGSGSDTGLPLVVGGPARIVETRPEDVPASDVSVVRVRAEVSGATVRLTWPNMHGWRWLVEQALPEGRRLLTPVPLSNPVFVWHGLEDIDAETSKTSETSKTPKMSFVISRLDATREGTVEIDAAHHRKPTWQVGFPKRCGTDLTSVQYVAFDGPDDGVLVFGDAVRGVWALRGDGTAVRSDRIGVNGCFRAIPQGTLEPMVADLVGSSAPEVVVVSRERAGWLYAFELSGQVLEGFPVGFPGLLSTPPLVGDFDGEEGREILVVSESTSGSGSVLHLVKPDGTKHRIAKVGAGTCATPVGVDLDGDSSLEIVILDGAGDLWVFDPGGAPLPGFPVALGAPAGACPVVADVDGDGRVEIVAVAQGTARVVVVDPATGERKVDLFPFWGGDAKAKNRVFPALARLGASGTWSIVFGNSGRRLLVYDFRAGGGLVFRKDLGMSLPARVCGIAAVDVDADGLDELFLALDDGQVWGLSADGWQLPGFPLRAKAEPRGVPLLDDLDGDGDLELVLGFADGVLRVWDLPYAKGPRAPTWPGLQGGAGLPGTPGERAP